MASFNGETFTRLMVETLKERVYHNLKKSLLETIEPEVNQACREAVESMNISALTYRDHMHYGDIVKFLLVEKK